MVKPPSAIHHNTSEKKIRNKEVCIRAKHKQKDIKIKLKLQHKKRDERKKALSEATGKQKERYTSNKVLDGNINRAKKLKSGFV